MSQDTGRKPSPILALHERWEQTQVEYAALEAAEHETPKGDHRRGFIATAMQASCREWNAIADAILHQVPDSWREAMILQFHIINAFDLMSANEGGKRLEWDTLETALETVFDFMACELPDDHEAIGAGFRDGAIRVFNRRRLRTGIVEG